VVVTHSEPDAEEDDKDQQRSECERSIELGVSIVRYRAGRPLSFFGAKEGLFLSSARRPPSSRVRFGNIGVSSLLAVEERGGCAEPARLSWGPRCLMRID
jgi:hypothetical protein